MVLPRMVVVVVVEVEKNMSWSEMPARSKDAAVKRRIGFIKDTALFDIFDVLFVCCMCLDGL